MKTIVINSAKGGVGKTRTSIELAKSFIKLGHAVAVIDLDITTPNIKEQKFKVYSNKYNTFPNKSQVKNFIKKSVDDAKQLEVDYLIIDTPPTINEMYLSISSYLQNAEFIFVTTRDKNSVNDTAAGMRFFALYGIDVSKVIINMGDIFEGLTDDEIISELDAKIVDVINKDDSLNRVANILESLYIKDFKLTNTKTKPIFKKLSNITEEEVQDNPNIPIRFYNLETWDIIRDRIIERENFGKSQLDVSVEQIKPFLQFEENEEFYVQISRNVPNVAEKFLPFEIVKVYVTLDNSVSKGLPMVVTKNGTHLWISEVFVISEDDISRTLDEGGINKIDYILLDLFNQMYMHRAFNRFTLKEERSLIELWVKKSEISPNIKDILFSIAILQNDRNGNEYDDFKYINYIKEQSDKLEELKTKFSEEESEETGDLSEIEFQESILEHLEILKDTYE